jgi:hypothetical protein
MACDVTFMVLGEILVLDLAQSVGRHFPIVFLHGTITRWLVEGRSGTVTKVRTSRQLRLHAPNTSAKVRAPISVALNRSDKGNRSSARWALASSMVRGPAPNSTIGTPAAA